MPAKPFCYILLVLLLLECAPRTAALRLSADNEKLLVCLDSLLENHDALVKEKETKIDALRKNLKRTKSGSDRLELMGMIREEYQVYDSDSALHYAIQGRMLAKEVFPDNYELQTEWKMYEAFIYVAQGMYDRAMGLLESIDSWRLSPELRTRYYSLMEYSYSMRALFLQSSKTHCHQDISKANDYRDSIKLQNFKVEEVWLWVPVARYIDGDGTLTSEELEKLKTKVDKSTEASRENAIDAYWLARYYMDKGDDEDMVRYMTKAAINDARIVNREIAAIQELAYFLFENGQLNRAYNYLLYSANQANLYHNRSRMVSLSDVLPTVRDAYRAELEKKDRKQTMLLWTLACLTIILLVFIVLIILEFRKLKKMRNLLRSANEELSDSVKDRDEAIAGLEKANVELSEANKQKLGILAYVFKLNSQHINALEDYRKLLLRKYKAKRYDEMGLYINDPELIKEQYQGFYESFDKIVLSIFPNLVEEYNSTVGEENQVSAASVAKSNTLPTRLRIYALKRLGVAKSADIAQMLNISIRTVYNNRIPSADETQD